MRAVMKDSLYFSLLFCMKILNWNACTTAWDLFEIPSFTKIWWTWFSTVDSLMQRSDEICRLVIPSAMRSRICCSRAVSPGSMWVPSFAGMVFPFSVGQVYSSTYHIKRMELTFFGIRGCPNSIVFSMELWCKVMYYPKWTASRTTDAHYCYPRNIRRYV